MSIRHSILAALAADGILLIDELVEKTGEKNRKRLQDNISMAVADKLVDRIRDETTRLPAYQITAIGRERLAQGVGSKGGEYGRRRAVESVAATGNKALPVEQSADTGEARQEQDDTEAIREIAATYMDTDGLDALGMFRGMETALKDALELISAWTDAAGAVGAKSVGELAGMTAQQHGFISVPKAVVPRVFASQFEARNEAELATLQGQSDHYVVALLDTASFDLVPAVKWGQA